MSVLLTQDSKLHVPLGMQSFGGGCEVECILGCCADYRHESRRCCHPKENKLIFTPLLCEGSPP